MKTNTQLWSELTEKEWAEEREEVKRIQAAHFKKSAI